MVSCGALKGKGDKGCVGPNSSLVNKRFIQKTARGISLSLSKTPSQEQMDATDGGRGDFNWGEKGGSGGTEMLCPDPFMELPNRSWHRMIKLRNSYDAITEDGRSLKFIGQ